MLTRRLRQYPHGYIVLFAILLVDATAYCQAVQSPNEKVLRGHFSTVYMGKFTPDGQRAVTASADETALLWDLSKFQQVRQFKGHTGPVYCLAVSGNGSLLVTGAQDNTLRTWDLPPIKPVTEFKQHTGGIKGTELSADGRTLATIGDDKQLLLWDLGRIQPATGVVDPSKICKPLFVLPEAPTAMAYRADNNLIAAADSKGKITFWFPFLEKMEQGVLQTDSVNALAFHSNNQQLLAADNEGYVRMWQLTNPLAKPITKNIDGTTANIEQLLLQSNSANAILVAGDAIKIVNLDNGQVAKELPKVDNRAFVSLAINNSLYAVANKAGRIHLFNINGETQGAFQDHDGPVNGLAIHPNAQLIYSISSDGSIRQWVPAKESNPEKARDLQATWNLGPSPLTVLLSADGSKLFVGYEDGKIRQIKTEDGTVERTMEGHTAAITQLALSPDGQSLASSSRDKSARIWKLADGTVLHNISLVAPALNIAFAPNGQRLSVMEENDVLQVVDVVSGVRLEKFLGGRNRGTACSWLNDNVTLFSVGEAASLQICKSTSLRAFRVHDQPILGMNSFNGGAQVITFANNGRVIASDTNSGQLVREFVGAKAPKAAAVRADNQRLAVGGDGQVLIWNANNAELLQTLEIEGSVSSLSWSVDNQKLAVATNQKQLLVFGPTQPPVPGVELVKLQQTNLEFAATQITFDRDNKHIWVTDTDGRLAQWPFAVVGPVRQFNHGGAVYGVVASRDGKVVVSCSADQTVRVWDTVQGQQRFQMNGHVGAVHALALSPDESFVVSSGADRTLRLWDVVGGRQLKQLITLDTTMYSVDIHAQGQLIAAGGADRKVYLLDIVSGAIVATLEGHTDYIHCVRFSHDGARLISYGYAGELRVWDVAQRKQISTDRVGRIGNYADFDSTGKRILLSNGDATSRVADLTQ